MIHFEDCIDAGSVVINESPFVICVGVDSNENFSFTVVLGLEICDRTEAVVLTEFVIMLTESSDISCVCWILFGNYCQCQIALLHVFLVVAVLKWSVALKKIETFPKLMYCHFEACLIIVWMCFHKIVAPPECQ